MGCGQTGGDTARTGTAVTTLQETWLALTFFAALGAGGIFRVRQLWRGPIFPWETPGLAALERAIPAFTVTAWLFVCVAVAGLLGVPSPWPEPFLTLFLVAFFVPTGLGLSAALFNWPKAIVPPHRRNDPGLLSSRPFRAARSRPTAAVPMPELPRWAFGLVAALVLVVLSAVLLFGWPPALLVALALPLVLLGGARVRR